MTARPAGDPAALAERLLGGARRYRRRDVSAGVGVSLRSARKLWRALGFANVGDHEVAFTEADALALRRVVDLVRQGTIDEDTAISCARALGQSTDRLVSWQLEALADLHQGRPDVGAATLALVTPWRTTWSGCWSTPGAGSWRPRSDGWPSWTLRGRPAASR